MSPIVLDTGPLVAALNRRDAHHLWSRKQFETLPHPFATCEAVLTEASHLLAREGVGVAPILRLIEAGIMRIDYAMDSDISSIRDLTTRYANVPMDLADACIAAVRDLGASLRIDAGCRLFHLPNVGKENAERDGSILLMGYRAPCQSTSGLR